MQLRQYEPLSPSVSVEVEVRDPGKLNAAISNAMSAARNAVRDEFARVVPAVLSKMEKDFMMIFWIALSLSSASVFWLVLAATRKEREMEFDMLAPVAEQLYATIFTTGTHSVLYHQAMIGRYVVKLSDGKYRIETPNGIEVATVDTPDEAVAKVGGPPPIETFPWGMDGTFKQFYLN